MSTEETAAATETTLRSIHLPTEIPTWPLAPGWWALAALVLLSLGVAYYLYRRYRKNAFRREALAMLLQIEQRQKKAPIPRLQLVDELSALLKRVAITRHGREEVAGRTGDRWLQFLDQTGDTKGFTQGPGRSLGANRFRQDLTIDPPSLITLCREWIQKQRC